MTPFLHVRSVSAPVIGLPSASDAKGWPFLAAGSVPLQSPVLQ
ncbi:hypothetical protein SXCC_03350 [Gluconacetobacter sp. SXCC-1]|nr:hypothetical protein SXCC_03350 [Gluconacetobacter sp. SXCC-1]